MMNFFRNQKGNVFFALFGAVAFVGVLGAATMSFMKGPLKTSVTLSRMSVAETQMQVASQMGVLQASTETDSGDCDADGFVEPIEFKVQATATLKPVGGGNIPDTLGASKTDPWGQLYGYCVWNSGTNVTIGSVGACDDDTSGTEDRLEGSPNNYDVVMAVISAGPDRTFQTTCQTFDAADANDNLVLGDVGDTEMIFKSSGSDDVILSYTYAEAATVGGGGLWSIKSSDPGTATIDKAIEFTGGLTMGTEVDVTVCSLDTVNQMRYNGVSDLIQVCDGSSWVDMSGGATPAGNETEIQFNTGGALDADTGLTYNSADNALTIDGSVTLGSTTGAEMPVLVSTPTLSADLWTSGGGDDIYYDAGTTPRVAIGTNSPTAALHVVDAASTTTPVLIENTSNGSNPALIVANTNGGGNAAVIGLNVTGTERSRIQAYDSGLGIFQTGNNPIGLYTDSTARLWITGTGDVGIANTSPDVELDVTGDIEYSGTITDVSDIRLKDNVRPLESSLEKVTSLEGISFTMKDDEEGRTELGFSAQDVQKVYPELIKTAEDDMGSLSMNYVGLIAPLVESVKELKAENEQLRASVTALENSNHGPRGDDHEKWIYLLIGVIIGHCLLHILRHKCCSKKEG